MHMQESAERIAVVILNWNGKKDTLACLASLKDQTHSPYEIIVVDNGSTDGSLEAIREAFPQVHRIESKTNLGCAEGNNLGIRCALERGADYLLLLNNDTDPDPGMLAAFYAARSPDSILGAKLYLYDKPDIFDHLGGRWDPQTATFDLIANRMQDDHKSWEEPMELDYVCGAALFAPRAVFETVGLLEPRFFLIWEESDFCFRARRAGFTAKLCPQAKVRHKVSASFVGGKPHSTYFWWRNRLLFIERNCSLEEKRRLFRTIVFPEALHILKLFLLKTALLYLSPPSKREAKKNNLRKQRAALLGVRDYLLKRFGNVPARFL